ncbi:hypothetical protein HGRIS_011234 [Hohenbuehelia grisea]|uniref:Uncharacterized protein n=1 Tax=Hohenbuehelia grisea TaxID=104357 RepID=A0ABR3JVV1_9AGAR
MDVDADAPVNRQHRTDFKSAPREDSTEFGVELTNTGSPDGTKRTRGLEGEHVQTPAKRQRKDVVKVESNSDEDMPPAPRRSRRKAEA